MGWDFCDVWKTKADVRRGVLSDIGAHRVLASKAAKGQGNHFWIAVREDSGKRVVVLALLARSRGAYGYKLVDEGMGIYETDCPPDVLEAVKGHEPINAYAASWRAQVAAGASRAKYVLDLNNQPIVFQP